MGHIWNPFEPDKILYKILSNAYIKLFLLIDLVQLLQKISCKIGSFSMNYTV